MLFEALLLTWDPLRSSVLEADQQIGTADINISVSHSTETKTTATTNKNDDKNTIFNPTTHTVLLIQKVRKPFRWLTTYEMLYKQHLSLKGVIEWKTIFTLTFKLGEVALLNMKHGCVLLCI